MRLFRTRPRCTSHSSFRRCNDEHKRAIVQETEKSDASVAPVRRRIATSMVFRWQVVARSMNS
jgi:transposase-like protein